MRSIHPSSAILGLIASSMLVTPAHSILVRTDFEANSNYNRYVNLANQPRFDAVGALSITAPFATSGSSSSGLCSGSLISPTIVLTAAHCMFAKDEVVGSNVSVFTPEETNYTGTFSNGASVLFGGGSTFAATYGGQADRVPFTQAMMDHMNQAI